MFHRKSVKDTYEQIIKKLHGLDQRRFLFAYRLAALCPQRSDQADTRPPGVYYFRYRIDYFGEKYR